MAIKADLHMHSYFSGDSETPMETMVLAAIDKGLTHICFTEHEDMDYHDQNGEIDETFTVNADSYLYELLAMRDKYADKIQILFGVEIGVQPQIKRELAIFAKQHEYDFILSSTHVVNKCDPYYIDNFLSIFPKETAMESYLKEVRTNLKAFTIFDSLAHLDYAARYMVAKNAPYDMNRVSGIVEDILSYLIENEKALEINTGNLKHGATGIINPRREILEMYREMGGELITIGSDAHVPENIAIGFEPLADELKALGFKYYHIFDRHIPEAFRL